MALGCKRAAREEERGGERRREEGRGGERQSKRERASGEVRARSF